MSIDRLRILVFQHRGHVTPARLGHLLDADARVDWTLVELDEGQPIPALEDFDALIVLGGPMDVWDTDEFPWLIDEKEAIRHWVRDLDRPYLGMCFGHQMLADALGGSCTRQVPPAVGVMASDLTAAGIDDPIFAGITSPLVALQWNATRVEVPPADAVIIATSPLCASQAIRVGRHAWSWQWHIEIERDTIRSWGALPVHEQAAIAAFGRDGVEVLARAVDEEIEGMYQVMGRLCENFIDAVAASVAERVASPES